MLKLICITLLITPYISGHTYGIKTHVPTGSNDVQSHYRVEYSSPLTTATHTDSRQSSISSQYSKSYKTDSNGNVILSSSGSEDFSNPQFNDANHLSNGANNVGTSSYVEKHESRRIGDNSAYNEFVDNTLNRNLQQQQKILEDIQSTYGGNGKVIYEGTIYNTGSRGSELGSSISHHGSIGEGSLGSTISHQKTGSYGANLDSSVSHGNSGRFESGLQSSVSHQGGSNLGSTTSSTHGNDYGTSYNLGTKITHHNSRPESANLGTSFANGNSEYNLDRTIGSQGNGAFSSGLGSSISHSTSSHGTGIGTSTSQQGSHLQGSNLGSSISYGNRRSELSNLGTSVSNGNSGYGLGSSTHNQGSGTYDSGLSSSISHSTSSHGTGTGTYGTGLGSSVAHSSSTHGTGHQGSRLHGSNLGSSISYSNNKQVGDFGLSSSHSLSSGYGSGGSNTENIYNGLGGSDLYQQHFSYVKSHKFSKCPPGVTGQFALPDDCHKFLNCWQGDGHVQECGAGTVFNEKIRGCDFPSGNGYTC